MAMSSRALNWPRTSLAKHPVTRPNDFSSIRPQYHVGGASQIAEFSASSAYQKEIGRRAKEKQLDREFFLSLLNSASTKREAKQYLARFKDSSPKSAQTTTEEPSKSSLSSSLSSGVNLGSFYGASRAVSESPVFRQDTTPAPRVQEPFEKLHLALVKITTPQLLEDSLIDGVAKTLSQLVRLGMACCVVVDPGHLRDSAATRQTAIAQANRLSAAIDRQPDSKSFGLDSALSISEKFPGLLTVESRKNLIAPLRDSQVLVVPPIAYTEESPKAISVSADDAVLALTREFAGLSIRPHPDDDPETIAQRIDALQKEVSVDRVILLHPLGGLPAFRGPQASHVFINMEQEFDDIREELIQHKQAFLRAGNDDVKSTRSLIDKDVFARIDGHIENLELSRKTLSLLPSTASGVITSPQEVANSSRQPHIAPELSAVGTRRQRNPLIHNLLTDKPLLSSSLPPGRRDSAISGLNDISSSTPHTTFVKRGMPVTLLPDPFVQVWSAKNQPRLKLDDPSIDLPRLVHLIEDSFDRKLDVQNYLDRVNDRIAGLIVAGEYEGGAILTWETPPGVVDDGSEESVARMVPYLDKFAVLKRSQGAGGVADIVFNAMVRTCFPEGVCWRSRKDNPVNKWYFERSAGTWKLSESNWTMFWTTPKLPENSIRFQDYEAVCRNIQPSWADNKSVID